MSQAHTDEARWVPLAVSAPGRFSPESIQAIKPPGDPAAVIKALQEWMADDSGYDEAVWPALKAALEANRAGERRLFNE
jgi:hypothetical protein